MIQFNCRIKNNYYFKLNKPYIRHYMSLQDFLIQHLIPYLFMSVVLFFGFCFIDGRISLTKRRELNESENESLINRSLDCKKYLIKSNEVEIISKDVICPICLDNFSINNIFCKLECSHIICFNCLKNWVKIKPICPICRNKIQ